MSPKRCHWRLQQHVTVLSRMSTDDLAARLKLCQDIGAIALVDEAHAYISHQTGYARLYLYSRYLHCVQRQQAQLAEMGMLR